MSSDRGPWPRPRCRLSPDARHGRACGSGDLRDGRSPAAGGGAGGAPALLAGHGLLGGGDRVRGADDAGRPVERRAPRLGGFTIASVAAFVATAVAVRSSVPQPDAGQRAAIRVPPMPGRPDQRILVVIPAWNEAGVIAGTIAEVRASQPDLDILVVDDGSGDGTAEVARTPAPVVPAAVQPRRRRGDAHGLPLRDAHGLRRRRADRRRRPARPPLPPELVAGLDHADVVIGARFAGEGDATRSRPAAMGDACWPRCSPGWPAPGSPTSPAASASPTGGRSPCSPTTIPPSTSVTPSSRSSSRCGSAARSPRARPHAAAHGRRGQPDPAARHDLPRPRRRRARGSPWCGAGQRPPRHWARRRHEPDFTLGHRRRGRPSSSCSRCCAASACARSTPSSGSWSPSAPSSWSSSPAS